MKEEKVVSTLETEIDPSFCEAKTIVDWGVKNYDLCLLLDTIEHLTDPTFCLDQINKSLKIEGYLLITTDNINNFLYILDMLRKGKSPNVHPVLSSKIYTGDWRPHCREYSRDELVFYLRYSGFELVEHEYFNRQQAEYFIDYSKNVIKKHKWILKLKNILFEIIKNVGFLVPHLRNHQILLVKKTKSYESLSARKTTNDINEWLKIRNDYIGY